MPPKRRIQSNAVLPASLAKQLADEGASNDKRFTKRFKNTAGSRKAARKQLRTEKKERKNQHHKRIKGFAQPQRADNKEKAVKPAEEKPAVAKSAEAKPRPKPKPKAEDERAQLVKFAQRNQGMYTLLRESNLIGNVDKEAGVQSKTNAAEELEDREMRRLERHLGIKNNAKLGSAFYDEGLGDMLEGIEFGSNDIRKPTEQSKRDEVSETGSMESNSEGSGVEDSDMNAEEAGSDVASDNGDDDDAFGLNNMDMDTGSESDDSDIAEMYRNQGVDADPDLSDIDSDGSDVDSDESDNSDIGSGVDDNSDDSASDEEMASEEKAVSDKDVAPAAGGAGRYIPPSLRRKQTEEVEDERVAAIRKTLQGQLNRLSESNIEGIVVQIEGQYQKYPRHYVTSVLTSLILQSIESRINVLDTFLYVNAAIVGAVYRIVGLEPVAHLVQTLMEEFERRFVQSLGEFKAHGAADAMLGKECQNLCVFVAELYNFQVVSCQLVYDMIRLCIEDINEFTAELLLKVIRISGQQLRKDDPLALKEIVRQVTEKVGKMGKLSARCRFMVESLTSLKDNRMRNAMAQNADNVSRLKRFLGNMDKRRAVGAAEPINIGLQDIRDIKTKGKWWLVGASWVGNQHNGGESTVAVPDVPSENSEMERLLQMAKAQHMNTDVRRSIFVTLLSSTDYADAFERLLKLDLKKTQAREMMRVILHCCGQEQAYNAYYTLVAYKLCSYHNTYRLTLQYALWDFLRELGESDVGGLGRLSDESGSAVVPLRRIVNVAKLYAWLLSRQALSLLILKTVTFARVGDQARVFFQVMFTTLFTLHRKRSAQDEQTLFNVFHRAAANPTMCHGILFFFHHFVRNCELVAEDDRSVVKWGCRVAKQAVRSSVGTASFDDI